MVAQEIAVGIEGAVDYWLGRVERELGDPSLAADAKVRAIALILEEYKQATGKIPFCHARA
jgi:hypothetical protein